MTVLRKLLLPAASLSAAMMVLAGLGPSTVAAMEHMSYKNDVLPVIKARCLECHQPGGEGFEKSGLDLRTYEGLMKGTKFGPVVVPGDAFTSNFNVMVEGRANENLRMPHNRKKLTQCEIGILRLWVNQGAKNN